MSGKPVLEKRRAKRDIEVEERLADEYNRVADRLTGSASLARISVSMQLTVESWNAYSRAADLLGLHRASFLELVARNVHKFRFNAVPPGVEDPAEDLPHLLVRSAADRGATLQTSSATLSKFAKENLEARAAELKTSMGHLLDIIAAVLPDIHLFDLISNGPLDSPSLAAAARALDGTTDDNEDKESPDQLHDDRDDRGDGGDEDRSDGAGADGGDAERQKGALYRRRRKQRDGGDGDGAGGSDD
jgi:hypothetical protein